MTLIKIKEIDRSIFEAIRLSLVADGLYPDITSISDTDALTTAENAIVAAGTPLVKPFGVGSASSKKIEKMSTVVVQAGQIYKDGVASSNGCVYYEGVYRVVDEVEEIVGGSLVTGNPGNDFFDSYTAEEISAMYYKKYEYPKSQKSLNYTIHLDCSTIGDSREAIQSLNKAFNARILYAISDDGTYDTTRSFYVDYGNMQPVTNGRIISWVMPITVGPVWLDEPTTLLSKVPVFTTTLGEDANAGIIVTPNVDRTHTITAGTQYEVEDDEDFIEIIEK